MRDFPSDFQTVRCKGGSLHLVSVSPRILVPMLALFPLFQGTVSKMKACWLWKSDAQKLELLGFMLENNLQNLDKLWLILRRL